MSTHDVRVALIEDERAVLEALDELVRGSEGLTVAGSFSSADEALSALRAGLAVDVVLLDLGLSGMSGQTFIRELKGQRGAIEIMVLTVFEDDESVYGALRSGASGYLLKDAAPAEIAAAILQVHEGGAPMSPSIARRVLQQFRAQPAEKVPEVTPLTSRETQVLELLTKGATYPMIGRTLEISTNTVQSHIRAIYRKLEVSTKSEATAEAYRRGFLR